MPEGIAGRKADNGAPDAARESGISSTTKQRKTTMNTSYIDPTDIYCRLKPRATRRPTARDLAREYCDFRRTRFGAFTECWLAACALFLAALAVAKAGGLA